jgi:hypothetical protein
MSLVAHISEDWDNCRRELSRRQVGKTRRTFVQVTVEKSQTLEKIKGTYKGDNHYNGTLARLSHLWAREYLAE